MSFSAPARISINESSPFSDAHRDIVANMKGDKAESGKGGSVRLELRENGRELVVQLPVMTMKRGVSTELKDKEGATVDAAPSVALYVDESNAVAYQAVVDLMNAVDERGKAAVCEAMGKPDKAEKLEKEKKKRTPKHVEDNFCAWDSASNDMWDRIVKKNTDAGKEIPPKFLMLRTKLFTRKDGNNKTPNDWNVRVTAFDDDNNVVEGDKTDLRRGNIEVVPKLRANYVMKSSKGYEVTWQLTEVHIVKKNPLPEQDALGSAATDPYIAELSRKRKAAAAAGEEEPASTAAAAAPDNSDED